MSFSGLSNIKNQIYENFKNEYTLFCRLYYKSKNQHRTHLWLRQANTLKRLLTRFLTSLDELLQRTNAFEQPMNKKISYTPDEVPKVLVQLSQLLDKVASSIKKLYIDMSRLLAQEYFIPLSMAVLGNISRMSSQLESIKNHLHKDMQNLDSNVEQDVHQINKNNTRTTANTKSQDRILHYSFNESSKKTLSFRSTETDHDFGRTSPAKPESDIRKRKLNDYTRRRDDPLTRQIKPVTELESPRQAAKATNLASSRTSTNSKEGQQERSSHHGNEIDDIFGALD